MGAHPIEMARTSALRAAIAVVVFKDSGEFRQFVFADFASRKPLVRAAIAAHRLLRKTPLGTLMMAGYGLKSFLAVNAPDDADILAAASYRNEHRQLDQVESLLDKVSVGRADFGLGTILTRDSIRALIRQVSHPGRLRDLWNLIDEQSQSSDFLVAARVASTVGYYERFGQMLDEHRPRAIVVSSDSNPYAMGLTFGAKNRSVPTIYITHGHLPDGPPALMFDLSILDGPQCATVYEEAGPIGGEVVFRGSEGTYRPLRTAGLRKANPSIGIFCSLVVDWERLGRLVGDIQRTLNPSQIVLRLHPNKIIRDKRALDWIDDRSNVTISDGDQVLTSDADRCDVVFVGNSSCHLTVLKYGVPTIYVRGLDKVPHDFYRLLKLNVVPAFESVGDVGLADVANFYEAPEWPARFTRFDAAYEHGVDSLDADVKAALERHLEPR
ncbi:MAG: hypothetical protein ACI9OJ_001476 [Myxococcota bacterium]|jgi:hypothetical protein